jgi:hypothetical protein
MDVLTAEISRYNDHAHRGRDVSTLAVSDGKFNGVRTCLSSDRHPYYGPRTPRLWNEKQTTPIERPGHRDGPIGLHLDH